MHSLFSLKDEIIKQSQDYYIATSKEDKQKIKESAKHFSVVHDICGVKQCLDLARANLKVK